MDPPHSTLAHEASRLSRTMQNREDRRVRHQQQEGDDRPRKRRKEPMQSAQAAYAAALAAASLAAPTLHRCDLCQASFTTEVAMQQHLSGPVHKKAAEKAAREAAQQQQRVHYNSIAETALQAAAWQGQRDPAALSRLPQQQQQRQQQQQQQRRHQRSREHQSAQHEVLSHEQMLAQARQADPLSLDGWVPPSIPAKPKQQQQQQQEQPLAATAGGGDQQEQQQVPQQADGAADAADTGTGAAGQGTHSSRDAAGGVGLLLGYAGSSSDEEDVHGAAVRVCEVVSQQQESSGPGGDSEEASDSESDPEVPHTFTSFF